LDLANELRERDIPFMTFGPGDRVPAAVGVVLTSKTEIGNLDFPSMVAVEGNPQKAVSRALDLLVGKEQYGRLVIGIDPGKRPGIAVLGDRMFLYSKILKHPQQIGKTAKEILSTHPARFAVVKVGHGDPTVRDRIINMLLEIDVSVEMVNEQQTSAAGSDDHADSAERIARLSGKRVLRPRVPNPSPGEVRRVQYSSRIASNGRFTISKKMAHKVARGDITMDEAIQLHQKGRSRNGTKADI